MSINPSDYVFSYTNQNAPVINARAATVATSAVAGLTSAYLDSASEYASAFAATVQVRDYLGDRLMKDLCIGCEGMASAVNLKSNTISLHQKANELYAAATSGAVLSTTAAVTKAESAFNAFYSSYYMDDEHGAVIISTDAEYYETSTTYDLNAKQIPYTDESDVPTFITAVPNATGKKAVYNLYDDSNELDVQIKWMESNFYVGSSMVQAWVATIGENEDGATVVSYSTQDNVDAPVAWSSGDGTSIGSGAASSSSSEAPAPVVESSSSEEPESSEEPVSEPEPSEEEESSEQP